MHIQIQHSCSAKYTFLLRMYCGMSAFIALCASFVLSKWNFDLLSFSAVSIGFVLCFAAVIVPRRFGKVKYLRSGGCIRIEKGLLTRKTLFINRSDIRGSEIRRGFVQRRLGLCTLLFFTGSGKVAIRGIELTDGRLLDRIVTTEAM